jgi:hypothetical protein
MKTKIVIAAAAIALAMPVLGTGTAQASSWKSCSAPSRTITGYEYYGKFSGLEARSQMNCASARYAYASAFGTARRNGRLPISFSDGYVTWHRRMYKVSGPTDGCGTWRYVVTYNEYSSGTAFRFRLLESGC